MTALRILIADDHDVARSGIRRVLTSRPEWTVCAEAADGWDALEKAKSLRPDVAILDVRMPGLGGLQVAARIKQEFPEIRTIILSQLDLAEMHLIALGAGACGFVSKYDIQRDLVSTIESATNGQKFAVSSHELPVIATPVSNNAALKMDYFPPGSQMGALIRSVDWSRTPIGPVDSWSPTLQTLVKVILANRFQLFLWWGPTFCQIYNDACRDLLGKKHPKSMGQPASECWEEIWHVLGPLIETPYLGGEPSRTDDICLEINRHGFTEETHFTLACSPISDPMVPSRIGGVLGMVQETTEKIVAERRVLLLRDLASRSVEAKTVEGACGIAAEILAQQAKDVPFALLYLVDAGRKRALLAATAGIGRGQAESPLLVELAIESTDQCVWPLAEVFRDDAVRVVQLPPENLPNIPPGPWSDPPHSAVVLPIPSNVAHQPAGLLVLGISSRLRFDDHYLRFCELVSTQVAATVANARACEEERKRGDALANLDRAKTVFFSNVSHEFRTPLALILGPTEEALQSPERELRGEELESVHRNQLRLLKLVNTLLDFFRIEAARMDAAFQPTDLARLTADLASSFRSAMERAGLKYEVDCEPLSCPVFVDPEMWEKIVLNLLSNAFKFTFKGVVSVAIKSLDESVQLQVRDTGAGIPELEIPHIFERFHRVAGAHGRTYEGTGIGLALVQELVKLHGGTVSVVSKEEVGSTFTVILPKGKSHLPPDRVGTFQTVSTHVTPADSYIEEALRWLPNLPTDVGDSLRDAKPDSEVLTAASVAPDTRPDSIPELIVLADDNSDMRDYIRRLLGGLYRVHGVSNGEDAVRAVHELHPDLVLTDVMMPGMDGFALLRALRADPATRAIPVIVLSARAGEETRIEGLREGADDYLVKPFTARELLARVGAHLKMARIRSEAAQVERRLRAEIELERNRLRDSFVQAPAAMALLSGPVHRFVFANAAYLHMAGRSEQQVLGNTVREVFPELERQGFFKLLDRAYQSGEPVVALAQEVTVNRNEREERLYVDFTYYPMRNLDGKVEGILFQGVDVTEQVLARSLLEARVKRRTALLERAQENLRVLNQSLMQAQDEERRRLALELHDSAGQLLAALKWKLTPLHEDIAQHSPELANQAAGAIALLDELSKELRTVTHLLHPLVLDDAGLSSALRTYALGLEERSGLIVDLELDGDEPRLAREVEMAVFRIVQEALTNVHRHAQTKTAIVSMKQCSENIRVEIQDHGRGIAGFISLDHPSLKMGIGLRGMRERVRQMGGNFEVRSGKDGTTVIAILPCRPFSERALSQELAS
jgi:PAS domain S-box-containing protein